MDLLHLPDGSGHFKYSRFEFLHLISVTEEVLSSPARVLPLYFRVHSLDLGLFADYSTQRGYGPLRAFNLRGI